MNKIRRWFKRPKEVENMLTQPLTAASYQMIITEMPGSSQQHQDALLFDIRELQQREEKHLKTTRAVSKPQVTAPLPAWGPLLQVEQEAAESDHQKDVPVHLNVSETVDTQSPSSDSGTRINSGNLTPDTCDINSFKREGSGISNTSPPISSVRSFLETKDDFYLSPSPQLRDWRRRLPCSLPCSPLLAGRCWRSSLTPTSSPSSQSRLWVEAALQRSKTNQHTKPILRPDPTDLCSPQESEWEERSRKRENEDEEKINDKENQVNPLDTGTHLSNTVIFKSTAPPQVCEREGRMEREDSDLWFANPRYCLLMPCVCYRCPSAPPYEAELFSAGDIETDFSYNSEAQTHKDGLTLLSLPRDTAPQACNSTHLYPSLSLWRITGDVQTELNRKQTINYDSQVNCSTKETFPWQQSSVCRDKVIIVKHQCRNCGQINAEQ